VPLPERRVLSGKPTWYEENFHATCNSDVDDIYQLYVSARTRKVTMDIVHAVGLKTNTVGMSIRELVLSRYTQWTDEQLRKLIHALHLPSLSGTLWKISKTFVKTMPYKATFEEGHFGGESVSVFSKPLGYEFGTRRSWGVMTELKS
jgi:hypothetical protein